MRLELQPKKARQEINLNIRKKKKPKDWKDV